jgi:hypothetical protein
MPEVVWRRKFVDYIGRFAKIWGNSNQEMKEQVTPYDEPKEVDISHLQTIISEVLHPFLCSD